MRQCATIMSERPITETSINKEQMAYSGSTFGTCAQNLADKMFTGLIPPRGNR